MVVLSLVVLRGDNLFTVDMCDYTLRLEDVEAVSNDDNKNVGADTH